MNRQDWEKRKKQMKSLLEKGIEELKELAAETSYLTDATTNTVKMEMDVHRLRTRLEKTQIRLGREVARSASPEAQIKPSKQIEQLIKEIRKIESQIQEDEKQIKKIPLTWAAAKTSVNKSKKPSKSRKAARPKKSATGKQISK